MVFPKNILIACEIDMLLNPLEYFLLFQLYGFFTQLTTVT